MPKIDVTDATYGDLQRIAAWNAARSKAVDPLDIASVVRELVEEKMNALELGHDHFRQSWDQDADSRTQPIPIVHDDDA